jgi:hypothetical protein
MQYQYIRDIECLNLMWSDLAFQIAATNVLKRIELAHWSHVDFHNGFGTVFQGVHRVFTLPGDR